MTAHAEAEELAPDWLHPPADVNELVQHLWSAHATKEQGRLAVAGVDVVDLARRFGTPTYIIDEADFRSRARAFRDAFPHATVYYASKAFLCIAAARWVSEEGLSLDVCSSGELTVAQRAGFDPARIAFHGNNKSVEELTRAVRAGVGRVVVDSPVEIERLSAIAAEHGVQQQVLVRVTAGVQAHTHDYIATAHEDQKFGFSLSDGAALDAVRAIAASPALVLRGLHSHIGSQIFDTSGFRVAAQRILGLHKQVVEELRIPLEEVDLGGGFGIAYTTQDRPAHPADLASGLVTVVAEECRRLGIEQPHLAIEPGRAISGPSTCTLYEVGTVKTVPLSDGGQRLYVAVDGGMSDNVRPALYGADFSCTLASRRSDARPALARVVGKHCESGDIVVRDEFLPSDIAPGDLLAVPATGAYCHSLASTYNHVPRSAVVAVRDGEARPVLRRETEEDLLRLEVC